MNAEHTYRIRCSWSGSTGAGYQHYAREHTASSSDSPDSPAAASSLALSADGAFLGRPDHLNPEQLVVMAAASCQLLSFLAVAARARVDVLRYEDAAEGVMPTNDHPIRLTKIVLRPRIVLASGPTADKVRHLVEIAHRECYIANSLRTDVEVLPIIEFLDPPTPA